MVSVRIAGALEALLILSLAAPAQMGKMRMRSAAPIPEISPGPGRVVYHLNLGDTMVNYTGKRRRALAVNGSIPAPTLYFTEGDTAVIYVHNNLKEETSVHWHGILLPNRYDGVSYLTTAPIPPGGTHLYRFPIVQHGTYWYHSHTMFQEQSGLYGAIIIRPRANGPSAENKPGDRPGEYTLLLSDWTNENPLEVDRSLHNATDWYAIRKGSTQNYARALKEGYLHTKLGNEWKRMMAMDVSDVAYDMMLSNGRTETLAPGFLAGDTVRLHIVNGSSSTYFWLGFAGGRMTVVANDGMDVAPVMVDRMIIAVAETYDVLVTLPADRRYEFRATAEDRTRSTSLWVGDGDTVRSLALPALNYFEGMTMMNGMMRMDGTLKNIGMQMANQSMDMNRVMYREMAASGADTLVTLSYNMLRSPVRTTLPDRPVKILRFNLTGNMNRYVWSIDNRTVSESDRILIHHGENVRIILYNGTMMRHPMHLHGHFFRVLNGQGEYSPLKNTLDIMPMETDTLEFSATAEGDWFFHCHILYHMMSGMGRIFSYDDSTVNEEVPDRHMAMQMINMDDRRYHWMADVELASNGSDGEVSLANTRYRFQTEWEAGLITPNGYESEGHLGRYIGRMQYWYPYVGWDIRYWNHPTIGKSAFGQTDTRDDRKVLTAGIEYLLPMLVVADLRVDMLGRLRLQVGREGIPLTARLRLSGMINTDKEYTVGMRYILTKYISLSARYDSDMGGGAGITVTY